MRAQSVGVRSGYTLAFERLYAAFRSVNANAMRCRKALALRRGLRLQAAFLRRCSSAVSSITSFSARRSAELDVGLFDAHVGLDAASVNRIALRGEVLRVGEPEPAILGQLHEFLDAGASERALADDVAAIVAIERRDEQAPPRRKCRWSRASIGKLGDRASLGAPRS